MFLDVSRLARQGGDAATVVRLMMACNDLVLANAIFGTYDRDGSESREYIRRGAGLYLIRLQIAHLYESLKVVADIASSASLSGFVMRCPAAILESFQALLKYTSRGEKRKEFERRYGKIRNTAAFHYDPTLTLRALKHRSARHPNVADKITTSDDIARIRFQVADNIVDTLVCRQVLEIPVDADAMEDANRFMESAFEVFRTLIGFAIPFIERYIAEYAAK